MQGGACLDDVARTVGKRLCVECVGGGELRMRATSCGERGRAAVTLEFVGLRSVAVPRITILPWLECWAVTNTYDPMHGLHMALRFALPMGVEQEGACAELAQALHNDDKDNNNNDAGIFGIRAEEEDTVAVEEGSSLSHALVALLFGDRMESALPMALGLYWQDKKICARGVDAIKMTAVRSDAALAEGRLEIDHSERPMMTVRLGAVASSELARLHGRGEAGSDTSAAPTSAVSTRKWSRSISAALKRGMQPLHRFASGVIRHMRRKNQRLALANAPYTPPMATAHV